MDHLFTRLLSKSANLLASVLDPDIKAVQSLFWRTLIHSDRSDLGKEYGHILPLVGLCNTNAGDDTNPIVEKLSSTEVCYLYPKISYSQLECPTETASSFRTLNREFNCNLAFLNLIKQNVLKLKNDDIFANPQNQFRFLFPSIEFDFAEAISVLTHEELSNLSLSNPLFVNTTQDFRRFQSLLENHSIRQKGFYLSLLADSCLSSRGLNC